MDYRDKPPSNETGSSFNRRNPAKWVRIRPALTPLPTSPAWFSALHAAVNRMGFAAAVWDLDSGFGISCGEPGAATLCEVYEGVFP